ncbi:hypothetical protein CC85DRAFT_268284 [Cutaneotrichosporon oleaginosum]|uniref:Brl1/Brr6 domain-containing protein n=1 Tax=Cutaneotrichosporon oleaginosum TaxID=879819 RepID=A0A0J1BE23_9TREE|nr:uncharacterized protein CC85DRAFT_268284 [Cutaneotrichosporon oleaginosum]KLT46309.1 hypothetical protein CC85DRAFT_268284 [Cutaneotrichosporon oleaginosum]TXT10310.1 hypothetical protein COLE_04244 [Cutaneotrichosporon oleaginosum]
MFKRDTSGPMEVDSVHPLGRAAEYALDDDGPARKRPHSELGSGGFAPPSRIAPYSFGPNTPFLFHAPPPPPTRPWEPYDPNKWARTDFGLGTTVAPVNDVDMDASEQPGSPGKPKEKKSNEKAASVASVDDPASPERKIATGAITRVRRRRRNFAQEGRSENTYNLHMAQGTRHSEIPSILLGYVQFVFNGSLVLGFLYVVTSFVMAVQRDVKERIEEYSIEYLQEISECSRSYLTNRCEAGTRVPAMEAACQGWELCMNRDPKVVGRARVGAETFAGIINSFFETISWKTMVFTVVSLTLFITLINSALFNLRAKQREPAYAPYPYPPPAPWMHGYAGAPGMLPPLDEKLKKEKEGVAGKAIAWFTK